MRWTLMLIPVLLLACGHRSKKGEAARCPEYQGMVCFPHEPECSMDRTRGCQVCQCPSIDGPSNPIPPDRRPPW